MQAAIRRWTLTAVVVAAAAVAGCAQMGPGKQVKSTSKTYPAIGPYSQMVENGNTLYLSGVIPLTMDGKSTQGKTIEEQTRVVLYHIGELLKSQGLSHDDVLMSNVFMKDLNDFARMNAVYGEYFKNAPPARATVQVARLPRDVLIEIAVVAARR